MAKVATTARATRRATAAAAPAPVQVPEVAPAAPALPEVPEVPEVATPAPAYGLRAAPTKQGTRRTMLPEARTVAVLVGANPKRHGTGAHVRFAQYMALQTAKGAHGFTVADVLNTGVQPSDLLYNLRHGYIEVQGVTMQGGTPVVQG